jgi:hypothetical protein
MKVLNLKEMEVVEGGSWYGSCGRGIAAIASVGGIAYGSLLGGPAGAIGAGLVGCAIGMAFRA